MSTSNNKTVQEVQSMGEPLVLNSLVSIQLAAVSPSSLRTRAAAQNRTRMAERPPTPKGSRKRVTQMCTTAHQFVGGKVCCLNVLVAFTPPTSFNHTLTLLTLCERQSLQVYE